MDDKKMYFNLEDPEHAYILGYFWADCYFGETKKGNLEFSFEIKSSDFKFVWPILQKIGFDKFKTRTRKNSITPQSSVRYAKRGAMEFFKTYNFHSKETGCPIFSKLSSQNKRFFVKGFLDGDGSISLDRNNVFRVGFNGALNQKWGFLESFCQDNSIKYVIYNKTRKSNHPSHKKTTHSCSVFEFTKIKDRIDFCELLTFCRIGLTRKLDVFDNYKLKYYAKMNKPIFEVKSVAPGIKQIKSGKFQSFSLIRVCGKQKHIGIFETMNEAIFAQDNFHSLYQEDKVELCKRSTFPQNLPG